MNFRAYTAELIGTFALIFVGVGAIAGTAIGKDQPGLVAIALAHGLTIAVMASATLAISGGHLNPAVTLGALSAGKISLVNATGYGARALFGDQSIIPVRGQLTRMIPQADVSYGLFYKNVSFVPRRDGMVFQVIGENDYYGYNDETVMPDRAEAERAVNTIASLFAAE